MAAADPYRSRGMTVGVAFMSQWDVRFFKRLFVPCCVRKNKPQRGPLPATNAQTTPSTPHINLEKIEFIQHPEMLSGF